MCEKSCCPLPIRPLSMHQYKSFASHLSVSFVGSIVHFTFICRIAPPGLAIVTMSFQKHSVLGVQRQSLITKGTGDVYKKERCPFQHYGFLFVEWFGQNGIPVDIVYTLRSFLIGPEAISAPTVRQRREAKQAKNPTLYLGLPLGEHIAVKDRELCSWIPNAMLSQFLVENKVVFLSIPSNRDD
jgi:hypothetical protein